jgi:asparagine N-glycosylation enzyme membrane subunit Stt3
MPGASRRREFAALAALALLVLTVAFGLHSANAGVAFQGGVPQFPPFDDQYQARRIAYTAAHFPSVLTFDARRGVGGAFCPWPPLYQLSAAAAGRLLGGKTPLLLLRRIAWFPPVLFSLFAATAAVLLARRSGRAAGLAAGLGLALSPVLLDVSRVASIDHHFLEPPLVVAIVAALVFALGSTDLREALSRGLLFGAVLTCGLLVQTALLFAAAVALAALLLASSPIPGRLSAAAGFAFSAGAVFLFRFLQRPGYPDDAWFLGTPHAAALLAAATATAVTAWGAGRGFGRTKAAALGCGAGLLAAGAVPGALTAFLDGSRFFGGDRWLKTIAEFAPLFLPPVRDPWNDFLGIGAPAIPALWFCWRAFSRGTTGERVLALFTVSYLAAAIGTARFEVVSSALLILAGAAAAGELLREGRAMAAGAAAVLLLAPPLPSALAGVRSPGPSFPSFAGPMVRAALASRSMPPGRFLPPWSWGHLFDTVGGRSVVVDNFGTMGSPVGFENALSSILAVDEETAAGFCRRNGIRFVVLENPLRLISRVAETVGRSPAAYLRPDPDPEAPMRVTRLAQATFWWRAYFFRGSPRPEAGRFGLPFRHFRLVWVDAEPSAEPPPYAGPAVQIWELAD